MKKITFMAIRPPKCLKDVDIEKVLVSNKISFGEQNCNYFLVTKTSNYVESYEEQTEWMCY